MKLEEILKSKGWTDAEITALQPMLADQRFRASMEESFSAVATERDSLKEKDEAWQRQLDEQWQPRVSQTEQQLRDARLQLAEAQERLKIAKDFGYIDEAKQAEIDAKTAAAKIDNRGFDPKNYVSMEDARKMLDAEARAITMAADLNNEYAYLHGGKTLYEYETEIDGRMTRGMEALRQEAKAKRMNMDQYVSQKFDFVGKRAALTAKRQQERDDVIRKEASEKTRQEMAEQYGNPLMRTAVPSRHATLVPKPVGGKQPWESAPAELKNQRIERAMKTQLTGTAN